MAKNKKKTLILNTLLLVFCCVIVGLYCLNPIKEEIMKTHLMSFDSEGGTAVKELEFPECSKVEEPANPTKEGYIFRGWTLDGEPFDFSQEVCGDIQLKAVWEEEQPEVVYIHIYIDKGDGSERSPLTIEEGTIPDKPADPTREGYTFKGWTLGGQPYNFDSPINDGAVITASWEEVKKEEPEKPEEPENPEETEEFTVKFNLNGGKAGGTCTDQKVKKNAVAKNVCKPTRTGFTLTGWSPKITTKITKNTTFVAQWKQNTPSGGGSGGGSTDTDDKIFTISFDTKGGTSCNAVSGKKGTSFKISSKCDPKLKYRTVKNWSYDGHTYTPGQTYTINGSARLEVSWVATSYTSKCTTSGDNDQDCMFSATGLSNSEIDHIVISYSVGGRTKNATYNAPFAVNNNVVWRNKKSVTIYIKDDDLPHSG